MTMSEITDAMIDKAAVALVRATTAYYNDPMPENPDLTLTRFLARAALEAVADAEIAGEQNGQD
jgi:hypothetical protein